MCPCNMSLKKMPVAIRLATTFLSAHEIAVVEVRDVLMRGKSLFLFKCAVMRGRKRNREE